MSDLKAKIQASVKEAMKARDSDRVQSLRMVLSAIQKKEMDSQKELSDSDVEKVLLTTVKQLQEAVDQAKTAGRPDLQEKAEQELGMIREFLPQPLSQEELQKTIDTIVARLKNEGQLPQGGAAMGAVMKEAMAKIGSRAEGKAVQGAVKQSLGL